MLSVADRYRGNNNFEYDLVDVVRQTVANKGYYLQRDVASAFQGKKVDEFKVLNQQFLDLILAQDKLLQTRTEFMLGTWTNKARSLGNNDSEKNLYEWNARTQITVWGNRASAGGLHNYAYKEWSGLLKDVYYPRWKSYFEYLEKELKGESPEHIDFFGMDEKWNRENNPYPSKPIGDAIKTAVEVYNSYVKDSVN